MTSDVKLLLGFYVDKQILQTNAALFILVSFVATIIMRIDSISVISQIILLKAPMLKNMPNSIAKSVFMKFQKAKL